MVEVNFNYEGINTMVLSNRNNTMKDIIEKFLTKTQKNKNNLNYLYNGQLIKNNLTFKEQANDLDLERNKMNIIVYNFDETIERKNEKISKDIICPKCKENILLNIKEFKISLSKCKNNHNITGILLNEFEKTQKINLDKIICNVCQQHNMGTTHNNEFYICNTCNKNICPFVNQFMIKNT